LSRKRIPVFFAAMVTMPLHTSFLNANSEYFSSLSGILIALLVEIQTERKFKYIELEGNPLLAWNALYKIPLHYNSYERISNAK